MTAMNLRNILLISRGHFPSYNIIYPTQLKGTTQDTNPYPFMFHF